MNHPLLDLRESRVIPASAQTLYDLLSTIELMPTFSPETVQTRWLDGARGVAVGHRFAGVNVLGRMRWTTTPTVTAADPGRRFAFRVPTGAACTWSYELEPVDGGTRVTESVRAERRMPAPIRALVRLSGVRDREAHLRVGITTTLARLAEVAVAAEATTTVR